MSNKDEKKWPWAWPWTVPLLLLTTIVGLWAFAWWWVTHYIDADRQGVFGDMFGAVNSLFSGLAFGGVVYAVILQRQELALQREELRLSREEFQKQSQTQAEMLRATLDQAHFEREKTKAESEPSFIPKGRGASDIEEHLHFENGGADIDQLEVRKINGPEDLLLSLNTPTHVKSGGKVVLCVRWGGRPDAKEPHPAFDFRFTYRTRLGDVRDQSFHIDAGIGVVGFERLRSQG